VDDIEAVASDPRIIFVASAAGGVFRSTNNGTTWSAVSDPYFAAMSVGDIAIAPSNPQIVWAGMGEPNNRQSSTWGDGVYKSVDGGTTWRHMGLRETQTIGRIVIDPRNPDVVFVAAVGHLFGPNEERGLFRTRDGGTTWSKVLGVDANTGATDVVMSPDGRTLVVAMYQRRRRAFGFAGSGPGSGLWRSTDGGDNWQRITTGLPAGDMGRIGLDISRSNPDVIYAVIEAKGSGRGDSSIVAASGVYRSNDRGTTWMRQSGANPRPNYFSQIRVDPTNPERVWLAGVYLTRSTDGGKTFRADSIDGSAHPDHHAMWIDPQRSEHMMLGNDGGVYFTYDGARNWVYADNLPIAQFYDIAIDNREPYWIYGGTQDNGSWAFPSATYSRGGMSKAEVKSTVYGDGFQAAVDPLDPRLVYANSQNGRVFLANIETHEEQFIQPVSPTPSEPYRFNWNTANHASPNDPTIHYLGAQKLLKTTNRGRSWQEISPDLTKRLGRTLSVGAGFAQGSLSANDGVGAYGNITTISESPKAKGMIYVGTDDGNVQMTSDGGATWTDITARFPFDSASRRASFVSKVLASRFDARTAYVAFDGHWDDDMRPHLFKTTDGGASWQSITSDLPNWKPVRTLAEDARNREVLYVGTEFGLYWTLNGARHWELATGNMPPVQVMKIISNEKNGDLVVATHGRGVIILDDASPLGAGELASSSEDVQLLPLHPATEAIWRHEFPKAGSNEFVAPNPVEGLSITYLVKNDPPRGSAPVRLTVLSADGTVVTEMTAPDTKGGHRMTWDLRTRFAYVAPAADSGFYGPPKAPYVAPGRYIVKLSARGREITQSVDVQWDPRGNNTPEALRARWAINAQGKELSRTYADLARRLDTLGVELARLDTVSKAHPQPGSDSTVADLTMRVRQLRARARQSMVGVPGLFDLLASIEMSSLPPTDNQERLIKTITTNLTTAVNEANDIATKKLPALRSALSQPAKGPL